LRPGFLPLLAAMIRDAAGVAAATHAHVSVGESVVLPIARAARVVEVRAPDGHTQRFDATTKPARFSATDSLGVYQVRSTRPGSGKPVSDTPTTASAAFVVDPPRDESDLSPGPLPSDANLSARPASGVSVHRSFTALLLLALFALVSCEGLVRARGRLLQQT